MPEYRKEFKNKTFYKIMDEGVVVRVINKSEWSEVKFGTNLYLESDVVGPDPSIETMVITEEEFNAAKSEAMTRLSLERI